MAVVEWTPPPSPLDEARRFLDSAKTEPDARERCQLIFKATLLDPSSTEAHFLRAKNGCAPAPELLADARMAHEKSPSSDTALVLVTIATRAENRESALAGAAALLSSSAGAIDRQRLAASTFARFGDHERAARAFETIASERGAKGATLDAIDARFEAAMASARAAGKGALVPPRADLLAAIQAASSAEAQYGGAWIGPKAIEAIAVLRASGDAKGATDAAKLARELKVVGPADLRGLELERGIAEARAGDKVKITALRLVERKSSRVSVPASRALLAVEARVSGRCGAAKAYARSHAALPREQLPRFDDDVTCAAACGTDAPLPTLSKPPSSAPVEDGLSLLAVDPARGRAHLQKLVDDHPLDAAANLALSHALPASDRAPILVAAASRLPMEPAVRLARLELMSGPARLEEARLLVKTVLPSTVEVIDDPRAAATPIAAMFAGVLGVPIAAPPADPDAVADLSEALLRACAAPQPSPACLPAGDPWLPRAAAELRRTRPGVLAKLGPALPDADLGDSVRLDVVLTLLSLGRGLEAEVLAGPKRGAWTSPEAALARASILAFGKKCDLATARLAAAKSLEATRPADLAAVKKKCP